MEKNQARSVSGSTHLQNFRKNLKARREEKGTSQTALADAMRERGHAFRQQTVQKIEAAGGRPVSLDEAVDLAAELETTAEELAAPRMVVDAFRQFGEKVTELLTMVNTAMKAEADWVDQYSETVELYHRLEAMDAASHLSERDRSYYQAMAKDLQEWGLTSSPRKSFRRAVGHEAAGDGPAA